jgi:hypothetical protein
MKSDKKNNDRILAVSLYTMNGATSASITPMTIRVAPIPLRALPVLDARVIVARHSHWMSTGQHCYSLQYFIGCSSVFIGTNLAKMPGHTAPCRPMSQARPNHARQDRADVEHYKVSCNGLARWNDFLEQSLSQGDHPKEKTVA